MSFWDFGATLYGSSAEKFPMMPALGFCPNGICCIFTFAHHYSTTVLRYIMCVAHVHY